jgi:hypothetical protein
VFNKVFHYQKGKAQSFAEGKEEGCDDGSTTAVEN